jgi:hypothetical protein
MGGFFGGGSKTTTIYKTEEASQAKRDTEAAQARTEARAEAATTKEQQGVQSRRRLMRTGGLRLLFSPARQEGPGNVKLGGGQ